MQTFSNCRISLESCCFILYNTKYYGGINCGIVSENPSEN